MNVIANFRETPIRSEKVLRSAKGQPCTARFPGICNSDPETSIWAHLNGAAFGKGLGIKAHDVFGFYCCSECHHYFDVGHGTSPILCDADLFRYVLSAVCQTWFRLIRAEIILVPEDAPKLTRDKPTRPRNPPEQRTKIPTRPMQGNSRPIQSRDNLRRSESREDTK